jgi:hypothetical protein
LKRKPVIVAFLVLVFALLGYISIDWLARNIEFYQEQVDRGESARARRNPLLAAQRFLTQSGIHTNSVFGRDLLYSLPTSRASLVISDFAIPMSKARDGELENWLRQGGHLIASLPTFSSLQPESFLKRRFGVDFIHVASADRKKDPQPYDLPFSGHANPVQVAFDIRQRIEYDHELQAPDVILEDDLGVYLLQYPVGEGRLTLMSDMNYFFNKNIGQHDHAYFLWLLTHESDEVWLMVDNLTPSLLDLAWRYNPYLVSALALFCLLQFIALWQRFGPLREDLSTSRRDILQHLHAVARFHLKSDDGRQLLASARASLCQLALRKHPYLKSMDPVQWAPWLATRSGLNEQDIALALDENSAQRGDLTRLAAILQLLKQRL